MSKPTDMCLCEFGKLVPRPDMIYRPVHMPGCKSCDEIAASQVEAYGSRSPTYEEWQQIDDAQPKADSTAAAAEGVEAAIQGLVTALAESKGWMRGYAEAIIRDAIDRRTASQATQGALTSDDAKGAAWQPIETAPVDSLLLLSDVDFPSSSGKPPVKVGGYWDWKWHIFGASWKPTHWMPLPDGPAIAASKAAEGAKG